jgi:hypothetical protein
MHILNDVLIFSFFFFLLENIVVLGTYFMQHNIKSPNGYDEC